MIRENQDPGTSSGAVVNSLNQYWGARRFVASLDTGIPICSDEVGYVFDHLFEHKRHDDITRLSGLLGDESVKDWFKKEELNWVR